MINFMVKNKIWIALAIIVLIVLFFVLVREKETVAPQEKELFGSILKAILGF